ncbi:terminase large subunit domain-containing protein [Streptomyces noursei]
MLKCEEGLSPRQLMRIALDPAYVMEAAGTPPDGWQADLLRKAPTPGMRGLVVSSRQAGKSTSLSSLAVWWALVNPRYDCLVIAPTLRQAVELVFKCRYVVDQLGLKLASDSATKIVLKATGGRIIALAATGHIRGMTAGMCIIDEGAWVPTSVMQGSVLPMLAAVPGGGSLVSATTPAGQRGWFYDWFSNGGDNYHRWKVPYTEVKRITPEYAAQFKASVSRQVWAAEMMCSFEESGGGLWNPDLIDSMFREEMSFDVPSLPQAPWSKTV